MEYEKLDTNFETSTDTKEGYYIGRDVQAGSEEAKLPLRGPNIWPDSTLLPNWKQTMLDYH